MDRNKLFTFITTTTGILAVAMICLLSVKTLLQMWSFTTVGAWLIAAVITIVPAFVINRLLTRAYLETCDVDEAHEFSSFGGTLGVVSLIIIAGLWLGLGDNGSRALYQGIEQAGQSVGLLTTEEANEVGVSLTDSLKDSLKDVVDNGVDSNLNSTGMSSNFSEKNNPSLHEAIKNSGSGNVTIFY